MIEVFLRKKIQKKSVPHVEIFIIMNKKVSLALYWDTNDYWKEGTHLLAHPDWATTIFPRPVKTVQSIFV